MALSQRDEALLWIGVELYPGLIQSVEMSPNPYKTHAVVYRSHTRYAKVVAQQIEKYLPQPVELISYDDFLQRTDIYAVFIVDPELHTKQLISQTTEHQILTFSPFFKAVQSGIDSGFAIKEQVRPQLNIRQLRARVC